MKKFIIFMLILVSSFSLVSCVDIYKRNNNNENNNNSNLVEDSDGNKVFTTYYLNDTHGAVLSKGNELGLSKIGNYINKSRDSKSIFITGGDIFQGQLISNHNKGSLMVDVFNELKLDAFVIGNHEFDWGLDVIEKFFDDSENEVKANFPILGANVVYKSNNKRQEFLDTHTIIDRDGYKIGIIGVIGDGLESSISTLRVKDYRFTDAYRAVFDTVYEIKDQVDFIMVANHSNNLEFNEKVSRLPKVSAVFNGHSHTEYQGMVNGIPYIQSRHNGYMVGKVTLNFLREGNNFTYSSGSAINVKNHELLKEEDSNVNDIINKYYYDVEPLYNETILISKSSYSQSNLANYISRVMMEVTNSVAGFQNSGGTRSTFNKGQEIKGADVFQVFPFDNQIIVVEIKGLNLKKMLNDSYYFKTSIINESEIIDDKLYQIATNDYIFYNSYNKSLFGDRYDTETLFGDMYEVLYNVMKNLKNSGKTHFDVNDDIIF